MAGFPNFPHVDINTYILSNTFYFPNDEDEGMFFLAKLKSLFICFSLGEQISFISPNSSGFPATIGN